MSVGETLHSAKASNTVRALVFLFDIKKADFGLYNNNNNLLLGSSITIVVYIEVLHFPSSSHGQKKAAPVASSLIRDGGGSFLVRERCIGGAFTLRINLARVALILYSFVTGVGMNLRPFDGELT